MTAKLPYDLINPSALQGLAEALQFGAQKHGANDWEDVPRPQKDHFAAVMRHLWAWWGGECHDPESGLSHLSHAHARIMMLAAQERAGRTTENKQGGERSHVVYNFFSD